MIRGSGIFRFHMGPKSCLRRSACSSHRPPNIKPAGHQKKALDRCAEEKTTMRSPHTVDVLVGRRAIKMARQPEGLHRAGKASIPRRRGRNCRGAPGCGLARGLVVWAGGIPADRLRSAGRTRRRGRKSYGILGRPANSDPSCNVQFGEGGAGTFSDGKLNTGVNNPRNYWVLEQFANAGAGAEILLTQSPTSEQTFW